jgi:hypothetical protein
MVGVHIEQGGDPLRCWFISLLGKHVGRLRHFLAQLNLGGSPIGPTLANNID